jgi:hypothetical protein
MGAAEINSIDAFHDEQSEADSISKFAELLLCETHRALRYLISGFKEA